MQVREFDLRSLDKMLPCPFCGGTAELDTHQAYAQIANGRIGHRVVVYCADCGADQGTCVEDAPDIHPNEVIERWNKRATSDAQAERVRVLAFALEEIKSDAAHVIDFYNRNGPTWTGKDGHEYDDMSSVLSRAETVIQIADAALKAAP